MRGHRSPRAWHYVHIVDCCGFALFLARLQCRCTMFLYIKAINLTKAASRDTSLLVIRSFGSQYQITVHPRWKEKRIWREYKKYYKEWGSRVFIGDEKGWWWMDYQGKEISRLMGVFLTYMKVQYESVNTFFCSFILWVFCGSNTEINWRSIFYRILEEW